MYAYYARTGDEKVYKFWAWIILPSSVTAMAISFVLKPRRQDQAYKVFLVLQYVLFTLVTEILSLVGDDFAESVLIKASLRSVLWLAFLKFGMKCRARIATLSDEDLSKFLTNYVIMKSMLVGLGQLAFLMFASIQCDGNADDWTRCRRTLYSQVGLSGMVTLFTIIKLLSGVVPKRILDKHVISPKKVLAMDLNAEQAAQAFGLFVAAGCALWPLGNYGAEGDLGNDAEEYAAYLVPSIGGFCLLLTAVCEFVIMRREMRSEGTSSRRQVHQGQSFSEDGTLVEASSFWFYLGVLATTYFSVVNVAAAVMMEGFYMALSTFSLPIVILVYIGSVICQPRRRSSKDMWKLRLHFMSFAVVSEIGFAMYQFRGGEFGLVITHLVRFAVEALLFHFGLKLRAAIGRLPDKELETFLVGTLFKGGLQTLFSILFLTFRTTKCMFEKASVVECSNTSDCSTMISVYLLLWWFTKIVQGSVRSEWRKYLNLLTEKIARMRGISLRRGLAGFLTLVTGVCGIFLFTRMSADEMDWTTISVVSLTGLVASLGVAVSEVYSSLKAQSRRSGLSESGQIVERATELEEPVEEVSGDVEEFNCFSRALKF
ncbi:hypothetical protein TL16_g08484 [Triparma laevis f. inornata]|uniref:Transmembrane protein n=1 Tax=Triparma laevis f. inornata TaxID=1714386 RepID=A0A9W7EGI6_9STRA|nr:hypothetical protein TL16_g08484 [Triparma laevis f. inornata]